jgi:hypothetical protein
LSIGEYVNSVQDNMSGYDCGSDEEWIDCELDEDRDSIVFEMIWLRNVWH